MIHIKKKGLALLISGIIFASSTDSVSAQIIPDATLGAESSVVNPDTTINGSPASLINGGATRGINLFHSFGEFNVGDGQRVYFVNPSGIENIISRVTGSNASNILGTLGITGGNANLFLINPNGIIFGQNARLDIGGSFVASTANAIQFGNNGFFSATNPNVPSQLLTINPSALFLNQISRGEITNRSVAPAGQNLIGEDITGLRVPDGKSLLLLGGNVNLEGGGLRAYEGRIELAGLAAPGSVGLNVVGNTLSFGFPNGVMRGNVSLSNGAEVNVRGAGAGDIVVTGRDIAIAGGSLVRAGIDKDLGTSQTKGGDIQINATGAIVLTGNGSRIANVLDERAFGKAGNININAETFSISDNPYVASNTFGKGDGGNIFVKGNNAVSLTGDSGIFSNVETGAVGKGGDINIQAGSLSLTNGAQLSLSIFGQGNAGNVSIRANGSASFVNSTIFNTLEAGAEGKGGDINIQAGSLSLTDGTQLQTLVRQAQNNLPGGVGNGGNVKVDVSGAVTIAGAKDEIPSGIRTSVGTGAKGNGGNITINADSFSLTDNATLSLSIFGRGNAGNVSIQANGSVSLVNGYIFNTLEAGAEGKGGDINIQAGSLSLTDGAQLQTLISQSQNNLPGGQGDGGNVKIDVSGAVTIADAKDKISSGIRTSVGTGAKGNAGNLTINADSFSLTDNATLSLSTFGQGNAGNVSIQANGSVSLVNGNIYSRVAAGAEGNGGDIRVTARALLLKNGGQLDARTLGQGKGGEIQVTTGSLSVTNGAQINASTNGKGNGGNVTIDARDAVTFEGGSNGNSSGIFSVVFPDAKGKGGNLRVTAKTLSMNNNTFLLNSTLGQGDAGNIFVQVSENISIANSSGIASNILSGGVGNGGNIDVETRNLTLTNGSGFSAGVYRAQQIGNLSLPGGRGQGGNIKINASDSVMLSGYDANGFSTGIDTLTQRGASGDAGDITVTTGKFRALDGAVISAATFNEGKGGDITINANLFELINGGQVLTNTRSSGNAGTIYLNVKDRITITGSDPNFNQRVAQVEERLRTTGSTDQLTDVVTNQGAASGLFASTTPGSTGNGGNIIIDPRQMTVKSGGSISVNSQGTGNTGNLSIQAGTLTLDNGTITARAASRTGGNINLNLGNLLLLRNGSEISTTAGIAGAGGDGGNITIATPFIVAIPGENSDITANAFTGRGGNVNITTQGIFGIEFRPQQTSQSDITASSSFGISGVVDINSPDTDSVQNNLAEFSQNPIDTNNLIANSCVTRSNNQQSTFYITGSGGFPTRPSSLQISPYPIATAPSVSTSTQSSKPRQQRNISEPIVEAQGVYQLENGQLVLSRECP